MKVKIAIIGELQEDKFREVEDKIQAVTKLFDYYSENWEYKRGQEK